MRQLRGALSGLCQPTYVLDLPGGHGKVPVGPGYVAEDLDGCVQRRGPVGRRSRLSGGCRCGGLGGDVWRRVKPTAAQTGSLGLPKSS